MGKEVKCLNILPPLAVMVRWREEGKAPEEIFDLARQWIRPQKKEVEIETVIPKRAPRIVKLKLPDDTTLIKLAECYTLKEIAKMYSCHYERVRQRLTPLNVRAISPREKKLKELDLAQVCQECIADGITAVSIRYGVDRKTLKTILPKFKHIKKGHGKLPPANIILEMLKSNTAQELADKYNVKRVSIYHRVRRAGLSIRKAKVEA